MCWGKGVKNWLGLVKTAHDQGLVLDQLYPVKGLKVTDMDWSLLVQSRSCPDL